MKDIRLIASDMDHTLLTTEGELPPGFRDDLRRLADAGITFAAASGRPLANLIELFPPRGDEIAYIGDNGAVLRLGEATLFRSLLPRDDYRAVMRFTLEATRGVPVVCGVDAGYLLAKHAEYEDYLSTFFPELVFVNGVDDIDVDAVKVSSYFPDGDSRAVHDQVFQPEYGTRYSLTTGSPVWVDIMSPGVHKGNALLALAAHLGLGPHQMMAFGDADNDLQMLDAVAHSYAVSNATETVRRRARFLADSNDAHGVQRVIREVLAAHAAA
ncbi:MAG: HAD family hydrolase [Propioniciclava sp.]|uniref:HAD hydrolase family protein n=1 Tax=Propioniciclava sp. TaxID=2038686 RepID=UPI0039E2DCA3